MRNDVPEPSETPQLHHRRPQTAGGLMKRIEKHGPTLPLLLLLLLLYYYYYYHYYSSTTTTTPATTTTTTITIPTSTKSINTTRAFRAFAFRAGSARVLLRGFRARRRI